MMKSLTRAAIKKVMETRYHRTHVAQALSILRDLEGTGRAKLGKRDRKLCDEYAIDVLGHIHYAPWLYVYSAVSGEGFKAGWIPDNYYGAIIVPAIQGYYGKTSFLRGLNAAIIRSALVPDLAYYANGIFFDKEYRLIRTEKLEDFLFSNASKIVYKSDSSCQGKGVKTLTPDTFSLDLIKSDGNGSFQAYIEQHPMIGRFAPSSVATLRLTTVYQDNGDVSLRACYLRFGDGKGDHVQSRSHIRLPINIKTGEFYERGYTPEWSSIDSHPTSLLKFAGHIIPSFAAAVEEVKQLHKRVPFARCVGWDVCIDSNSQPKVMEWNGAHNDIKFSEATQGPCFSDLGWITPGR